MNEDNYNLSMRKFLKKVGVTSQREIEKAVREALSEGKLTGSERLPAKVTLELEDLGLNHEISGEIALE